MRGSVRIWEMLVRPAVPVSGQGGLLLAACQVLCRVACILDGVPSVTRTDHPEMVELCCLKKAEGITLFEHCPLRAFLEGTEFFNCAQPVCGRGQG